MILKVSTTILILITIFILIYQSFGERCGSVVECLTRDRRAVGSSFTGVTALCPLSKNINPGL